MKRFVLLSLLSLWSMVAIGQVVTAHPKFTSKENDNIDEEQCSYTFFGGSSPIYLWGKVYRAKTGEEADLTIREAGKDELAEMFVGIVRNNPDECGLRQWTDNRKEADFSVRIIKSGSCHIIVEFCDGEKMRTEYKGIPCEDWSTGRPRPCK
jgi:hypothetical protein